MGKKEVLLSLAILAVVQLQMIITEKIQTYVGFKCSGGNFNTASSSWGNDVVLAPIVLGGHVTNSLVTTDNVVLGN